MALIIRSRHTFKRSGTMQQEMEQGGKLFFDLFVVSLVMIALTTMQISLTCFFRP